MHILKCRLNDAFGRQTVRLRADSKSARLLRAPRGVESRAGLRNTMPLRRYRAKEIKHTVAPRLNKYRENSQKYGMTVSMDWNKVRVKTELWETLGLYPALVQCLHPTEWYQKQLQSIHSNTAQLRTGRRWKDSIAFQAQKFNTTYSLVAGIFLNDALKNPP